jgi:hypothetical protein
MRVRSRCRRRHAAPGCATRVPLVVGGLLSVALLTSPEACALEARSRISGSFEVRSLADDDMQATYGMVPMLGLRWTSPMGDTSEFFLGSGYGWDSGNPYYGDGSFVTADRARLRVIPIELGVRMTPLLHLRRAFHVGFAVEYLWVREDAPAGDALEGAASGWERFSGWGWGVKALAGPEWRFAGGHFSIGGEVSLGVQSQTVSRGNERRRVSFAGLGTRALLSTHL